MSIGDNGIIGLGSVVVGDIGNNAVVADIPAKTLKEGSWSAFPIYWQIGNLMELGAAVVKNVPFKTDVLVKSLKPVMPDLIRHPELIEITGF